MTPWRACRLRRGFARLDALLDLGEAILARDIARAIVAAGRLRNTP